MHQVYMAFIGKVWLDYLDCISDKLWSSKTVGIWRCKICFIIERRAEEGVTALAILHRNREKVLLPLEYRCQNWSQCNHNYLYSQKCFYFCLCIRNTNFYSSAIPFITDRWFHGCLSIIFFFVLSIGKEPPEVTFTGVEFLTYDLVQLGGEPIVSKRDEISLYFRTNRDDGLLFYTGKYIESFWWLNMPFVLLIGEEQNTYLCVIVCSFCVSTLILMNIVYCRNDV